MNAKSLTIGGALVLLAVTLIGRVNGLITDDQLIYLFWAILIVAGSMVVSYGISWSATSGYKKYNWPPNRWREQAIKRKIFKCAWLTGGCSMLAFGSVVLICTSAGKLLAVYSILWTILSVMVGATSPGLRDFMVDNLIPRLKRWAKGRHECGNEALDRPTDLPK